MAFARLGDNRRAWELFDMINPVNHSSSPEKIEIYKVDPYVMAADVYSLPPHTGRGGWTWYTGSAGWMYRLIVESFLGLSREANQLRLAPCLRTDWKEYAVHYRYRETTYHIRVEQVHDGTSDMKISVDGAPRHDGAIPLVDDRREHSVDVKIGIG